jgi:hypothetical protein
MDTSEECNKKSRRLSIRIDPLQVCLQYSLAVPGNPANAVSGSLFADPPLQRNVLF